MRLFIALIVFSAALHICGIYFIPMLGAERKPNNRPPIQVEIRPIEVPKPKPRPPKTSVTPAPAPKPVAVPVNKQPEKTASLSELKPSGAVTPLVLPDIVVPKSSVESKPEVALPDVIGNPVKVNPPVPKGPQVESELASLEAKRKDVAASAENRKVREETEKVGKGQKASQIYNFDVPPTNNRSVSYAPGAPDFSLENDAKVTLKFSIDKSGNTSDIEFVTRNDARVESMAREYVSRMRFDAVINDGKDTAQVTLTFRVRK